MASFPARPQHHETATITSDKKEVVRVDGAVDNGIWSVRIHLEAFSEYHRN
jgi:hypothetical protein